ncbi:MAG: hypothetical protein NT175_14130 [Bacteroidetes bacterium]|nr:hypothetical protein [Bacteroidota bacterium]
MEIKAMNSKMNKFRWSKIIALVLLITGTIYSNSTVNAQVFPNAGNTRKNSVFIEGCIGYDIFINKNLKSEYGNGSIYPSLALGYYPSELFSFGVVGNLLHSSRDFPLINAAETHTLTSWPLTAFIRYNISLGEDDFYLFGEAGGGIAIAKSKAEGWVKTSAHSKTDFLKIEKQVSPDFYWKLGIEMFSNNKCSVIIQGTYSYQPIKEWDLKISGFILAAGFKYIIIMSPDEKEKAQLIVQ